MEDKKLKKNKLLRKRNIKKSNDFKIKKTHSSNKSFLMGLKLMAQIVLRFLTVLSDVSATNFNNDTSSSKIQKFINNEFEGTELVLDRVEHSELSNLNNTRNITIDSSDQMNIISSSSVTIFNINSTDIKIVNLNISGFEIVIISNIENLSIIRCNSSTNDVSINFEGFVLSNIEIENDTIISSISPSSWKEGIIYVNVPTDSNVSISMKNKIITEK